MKPTSIILGALAILASATACNDGKGLPEGRVDKDHGVVSFRAMNIGVDTDAETDSRAVDSSVDVSGYSVELLNSDASVIGAWQYSQMPEIQVLPTGNYSVKVYSHTVKPAAFDEPLYEGSENFTITEGEVHNVGQVLCKLANVKVSVKYSDKLIELMDASSTVTVEAGGTDSYLTFAANESRSGYFRYMEGGSTLIATFNGTVGGRREQLRKVLTDVLPGHHYILTYTVRAGGFIDPKSILLDASVADVTVDFTVDVDDKPLDDSDRPGGDDVVTPPVGDDNITFSSEYVSFTEPNSTDLPEAKVLIHADAGIAHLKVEIISDELNDEMLSGVGLAATFDLAEPGDLAGALSGLGFPVGSEVTGKTDVTFDITNFLPLLNIYSGTHDFKITVTDAKGQSQSRTISFIVG